MKLMNLKGTDDYLPNEQLIRNKIINTLIIKIKYIFEQIKNI